MVNKEIVKEDKNSQFKIDLNKIIKKTQELYPKKELGLAKQLSTGSSLSRPTEDGDFVVWSKGSFFKELTGLRGLPLGRIVQISGKPDSGKSSVACQFMVDAQQQGFQVILWDSERKFSKFRFEKMGGLADKLLVVDTSNILNGGKAVAHLVHTLKQEYSDLKILICWDSVGASINSSEDSEENEDYSKQPGINAKENSFIIKKFNKLANKYHDKNGKETVATLVINQSYSSIGMGAPTQINKGGQEIEYLSSLIIQLSRKQDLTRIKNGEKYKWGILTNARVKKNHLHDAEENIHQLELVVSASQVSLKKDVNGFEDVQSWGGEDAEE